MGQGSIEIKADKKPKRPMTAYNFFFKQQRQNILLQTGGHSGGFATLARTIATRWKSIGPEERAVCMRKAAADKIRYQEEVMLWLEDQKVEICTIEPFVSSFDSPNLSNGSSCVSDSGGGETTRESLACGQFIFNPRRNTPCTVGQNVSLELRRLDFIEMALADMNASAARRRRQSESTMMPKRRNQTPLKNLLAKCKEQTPIESFTPKNLRSVFEVDAQLNIDLPPLEYCSMELELDDAICFSEY